MLLRNRQLLTIAAKMLIDALAFGAASLLAVFLRFDGHVSVYHMAAWRTHLPVLIAVRLACTWAATRYRLHWRFTSLTDVRYALQATAMGSVIIAAIAHWSDDPWPRGVILLETFLALNLMLAPRLLVRIVRNRISARRGSPREARSVLVVGAGDTGERIVRHMLDDHGANLVPVGFVDDDASRLGRLIHGVPVLGAIDDVSAIVHANKIDQVLIAIPSLSGSAIGGIVRKCASARVDLTILPTLPQMLSSGVSARAIRKISVEDLLERQPVRVDMESIAAYTTGERILVTGGGGSIGSELCRQIVRLQPARLIVLGHDEACLYWIDQELRREYGYEPVIVVADVRDRDRLAEVFHEQRPTVVFHAAAHKHVPMMEANPGEAVKTNVGGTRNLAELSIEYGVKRFVMISTDKAVNPTSVMGATKRVAEMVVQSLAQRIALAREGHSSGVGWGFVAGAPTATTFACVRFGNVLGSSGSVVPTMQRQIEKGGPVTVTHPEMVRYFMTIPEAVQLVIQAGGMARGGDIFVLDMGEPVKILDLAWNLVRLSGFVPNVDIPIRITGIRPGEKLYEEVLTAEEGVRTTDHEKIRVARATPLEHERLMSGLMRLDRAVQRGDGSEIRAVLGELVPTYHREGRPAQHAAKTVPIPVPHASRAPVRATK